MIQAKKQYCANICLKINVKLGGMNSFISPSQVPFITDRPTILMGADVSHPGPGNYFCKGLKNLFTIIKLSNVFLSLSIR